MKKLLAGVLLILPVLLLSSCSKENVTSPEKKESTAALGKVSLWLDKVNAPANVSTVTATLARTEGDTLRKNLSMYGDSTNAEIAFENIKTGLWHLKIDAKGTSGEVLYSGETDVLVEDSKTTEVYLTLTPKPTGMGSVYISVKWGTTGWTDYPGNPIYTGSQALGNPYGGVSVGKVLFENGKYRLWYMNTYESGHGDVQYAESIDGIHWHNVLSETVLPRGPEGSWDSYMVGPGAVLKDETGYKMYYAGCSSHNDVRNVGLAFSSDGLHWQKSDKPVLTPLADESGLSATAVVKAGSMYYMYFTADTRKIKVAVSQDGIHWERNGTPALEISETWETSGILYPTVINDGSKFIMIYMNLARSGFGMAASLDGIHWTKSSKNPFFEARNTSRQWTNSINFPWILKQGDEMRLYYTAAVNGQFELAAAIYK